MKRGDTEREGDLGLLALRPLHRSPRAGAHAAHGLALAGARRGDEALGQRAVEMSTRQLPLSGVMVPAVAFGERAVQRAAG